MRYAKLAVAVLGAAVTMLGVALTDDTITTGEWIAVASAALAAVGVYLVPNRPA